MKSATFNRLAERELTDAVAYYEEQKLLGQHPEGAPRSRGSIRRFTLPRFPYSLQINKSADSAWFRVDAATWPWTAKWLGTVPPPARPAWLDAFCPGTG